MSNVEHGAIVAELSAGIEAACNALQAAIAADDGAATAAAGAEVSRLTNDLLIAEDLETAAGVDDAVSAQADLLFAASEIAASAIGQSEYDAGTRRHCVPRRGWRGNHYAGCACAAGQRDR